jgi:protein-tyrosine phosphatase
VVVVAGNDQTDVASLDHGLQSLGIRKGDPGHRLDRRADRWVVQSEHGSISRRRGELVPQPVQLRIRKSAGVVPRNRRVHRDDPQSPEEVDLVDGFARRCGGSRFRDDVIPEGLPVVVVPREENRSDTDRRRERTDALAEEPIGEWIAGVGQVAGEKDPLRPDLSGRDELDGTVEIRQRVAELSQVGIRDEMDVGELKQQVSSHVARKCVASGAGRQSHRYARRIEILFICTANICRSPMAEALMAKRIAELGAVAGVASAGLLPGGLKSPPEVIGLMEQIGADLSSRRSRQVGTDDLDGSDLVLTMEYQQLREVAIMTPTTWAKTFTAKELVRRSASVGGKSEDEPVETWIARVHAGREPADSFVEGRLDEVADPYGGTPAEYAAVALELESLVAQIADLVFVPGSVLPEQNEREVASSERPGRSRFSLVRRG